MTEDPFTEVAFAAPGANTPQRAPEGQAPEAQAPAVQDAPAAAAKLDTAPGSEGFDRQRQGAPRSGKNSSDASQSSYGDLTAKQPLADEFVRTEHRSIAAAQTGDFGEGNYAGTRGQTGRGGLSTYGNSSGSSFTLDEEAARASGEAKTAATSPVAGQTALDEVEVLHAGAHPAAHPDAEPALLARPSARKAARPMDRRVLEQIEHVLLVRPDLNVRNLSVTLSKAGVLLEGSVPTAAMRAEIEGLVAQVPGVERMVNRLTIRSDPLDAQATQFT